MATLRCLSPSHPREPQVMSLSVPKMCEGASGRCWTWFCPWFRRWLRRGLITGLVLVLALLVYIGAGWGLAWIPTNTDFRADPNGVEIAVVHNGLHTDVILPLKTPECDWWEYFSADDFSSDVSEYRFASMGWGNRAFYLETPTWSDVRMTTVVKALAGIGESVVHVDLFYDLPPASDSCRRIRISAAHYTQLVERLRDALKLRSDGRACVIPAAAYHDADAFYEATGHYSLFRTCNVWTGNALRAAGVRVGWWTPFAGGVFTQLPSADADPS